MPLATLLVTTLGPIIAKSLLKRWLGDTLLTQVAGGSFDMLVARFKEGATIEQKIERISQRIAASLADLEGLTAYMEPVIQAAADTLQASPIEPQLLVRENLDAGQAAQKILDSSPVRKDLSGRERDLHDRMVVELCKRVLGFASSLPRFAESTARETLGRLERLDSRSVKSELVLERVEVFLTEQDAKADRWFERLERQRDDEALEFEQRYRQAVAADLDRLVLFGVSVEEERRDYPLSVAYIQLNATAAASDGAAQAGDPVPAQTALANTERLLVRGDPGSGKTTLFRWLAVRAARQDFAGGLFDWNGMVPFYLPLRKFVRRNAGTGALELQLPEPQDYVRIQAPDLAGDMPEKWVHRLIKDDRALILMDGVDEIPESLRPELQRRLQGLALLCGPSRLLVSTRSYALEEGWGDRHGFAEITLRDLSLPDIDCLIDQWHHAVADNLPNWRRAKEAADLSEQAASLKLEIRSSTPVRHLARSPLLCALICALFRDRRRTLPETRIKLYHSCLELLLTRREKERDVDQSDYPPLTEDQKLVLLRHLAYWYLEHGYSEADASEVDARFDQQLQHLALVQEHHGRAVNGEWIRTYLTHRSGILRAPSVDRVDFAHKTFLEFLAAQQAVDADHIPSLAKNLSNDQWHEVIVLTAGLGTARQRTELLNKILYSRNGRARTLPRYTLLAAACLEVCERIDPIQRNEISERLRAVIPPRSEKTAREIADAGDLVLAHLRPEDGWTEAEKIFSIQILARIGGTGALARLEDYARSASDAVLDELTVAWEAFDRLEYARRILAVALCGRHHWTAPKLKNLEGFQWFTGLKSINLNGTIISDLQPLSNLTQLESLYLDDTQVSDLQPLSGLIQLQELHLNRTRVWDLEPLTALSQLQVLYLDYTLISDLQPLTALTQLRRLDLDYIQARNLQPLEGLTQLKILYLTGSQTTDLQPLAQLVQLQELYLSESMVENLEPLASLTLLTTLDLTNTQVSDLQPIACLSQLRCLYLNDTQVNDIRPLGSLIRLEILDLTSTSTCDFQPLAGLTLLRELFLNNTQFNDLQSLAGFTQLEQLYLDHTLVADLQPLTDLTLLQKLDLDYTQVSDLRPLSSLVHLQSLNLAHTLVRDLRPLAELTHLKLLHLDREQVWDLQPLAGLADLKTMFTYRTG